MEPQPERVLSDPFAEPTPAGARSSPLSWIILALISALVLWGAWQYYQPKPPAAPSIYDRGYTAGISAGQLYSRTGADIPTVILLEALAQDEAKLASLTDEEFKNGYKAGFKIGYEKLTKKAW